MDEGNPYSYMPMPPMNGGINVQDSPLEIRPNEVVEALNCTLTRNGAVVKRQGYKYYGSFDIDTDITGADAITRFYTSSASETIISAFNSSDYRIYKQGTASYSQITGGTTLAYSPIRFTAFRDYLLIYNGSQFQYYSSGTTKANVGYAAGSTNVTPDLMAAADNRLFAVDRGLDRNTVYFTELDGWGTGAPTDIDFATNNDFVVPERTSDRVGITALASYGNNDELIVFRQNDMWALLGNTADDYKLIKMNNVAGCVSPDAIATTDEGAMIFVGNNGIFELDGSDIKDIGRSIRPLINSYSLSTACCVYDAVNRSVLISYRQGCLVWNVDTRAWTRFDLKFKNMIRFENYTDNNKLVFTRLDSARLYEFGGSKSDITDDINFKVQTKTFDFDRFYQEKFYRGFKVVADAETANQFTVTITLDGGDKIQTKTINMTLRGALWDVGKWDEDVWGADNYNIGYIVWDTQRRGNVFSITYESTDSYDLTIYKSALMFALHAYTTGE